MFSHYVPCFQVEVCSRYSRLSLSRTPRGSLKYMEIPVLRHIRFGELKKNLTTKRPKFICNLTPLLKIYVIKLLWKRGEIAPKEQFSSYLQYFLPVVKFLC